jgi:hypothetical protein
MTEPTPAPAADQRSRLLVLAAAGAGGLVLLLVLLRLVTGGGDDSPSGTSTSPTGPPGVVLDTTTTTAGAGPAETFEVFTTKNPFLPLRSPGGGAPAPAAGGGAAPTGAGAATAGGRGATTGGSSAPGGRGTSDEPRQGARVALQDVFVEGGRTMANVRVNDTVHKVSAGQAFATNFKVMSLSAPDRCGRFLFGDDSFRLCKGEEVLK